MLGEHNYKLLKKLKKTWDRDNILNPGKITDTPSITENLRVIPGKPTPEYDTVFDFSRYKVTSEALKNAMVQAIAVKRNHWRHNVSNLHGHPR